MARLPFRPSPHPRAPALAAAACLSALLLAGCAGLPGSATDPASPYAPGIDPRGQEVDALVVADRLLESGQYDLAIDAYTRAAVTRGLTPAIRAGIGTASLQLGRLGQAERQLREASRAADTPPEVWNNLGLVLVARGELSEAISLLRRAYALDDGESDAIRDNLRLALAMQGERPYDPAEDRDFKVVHSGQGLYKIRSTGPG